MILTDGLQIIIGSLHRLTKLTKIKAVGLVHCSNLVTLVIVKTKKCDYCMFNLVIMHAYGG